MQTSQLFSRSSKQRGMPCRTTSVIHHLALWKHFGRPGVMQLCNFHKINKVDETTPFDSNMFLGKILKMKTIPLKQWPRLKKSNYLSDLQDKISELLPILLSVIWNKFPLHQLVNRPLFKMNNFPSK